LRVEGQTSLGYRRYRELVLTSSRRRLLTLWAAAGLIALGAVLISKAAGAVLLVGVVVVYPLWFDFSLRRAWRRLAAGAPALDIGYELTDEGMRISTAGTSTFHRWDTLRPLTHTGSYWLFRWLPGRRTLAVPKHAFDTDGQSAVDELVTRSR
jgi:YcxB-like protein